jgi:hypothetical protein
MNTVHHAYSFETFRQMDPAIDLNNEGMQLMNAGALTKAAVDVDSTCSLLAPVDIHASECQPDLMV